MKVLIMGLWLILSISISLGLIFFAGKSSGGTSNWKIVGKLTVAFTAFVLICIITFLILLIMATGYPKPEHEITAMQQIIGLTVIYAYGFTGYLLCSFVNGKFLKPWNLSLFNFKKT